MSSRTDVRGDSVTVRWGVEPPAAAAGAAAAEPSADGAGETPAEPAPAGETRATVVALPFGR